MTPFRVTPALVLVLIAVLLAAGCIGGDYIREQDVVIVKLNDNGDVSWTKTIDSGKDDIVTDILQNPDGNYVIAGGNSRAGCNGGSHYQSTPTLIWMSNTGDIIDQRSYSYGTQDGFIALFHTSDGSYHVISQNGIIWKIDQRGDILWNRSAGFFGVANYFVRPDEHFDIITQNGIIWRLDRNGTIKWNRTFDIGYVKSAIKTADSGYIVIGQKSETVPLTKVRQRDKDGNITWKELGSNASSQGYVSFHQIENATAAKLGSEGTIIWEKSFGIDGFVIFDSIKELKKNQGYQVEARTEFDPNVYPYFGGDEYLIHLADDGKIINITLIRLRENFQSTGTESVTNCDDSISCIQTDDGGFFLLESVEESRDNMYDLWTRYYAVKTNFDGSTAWARNITSFKKKMGFGKSSLKKIIQTRDGGYLVAFENENVCSCSGCNVKKY